MYKLLIVDDEKEIREGLSSIAWPEFGIQLAASCSQGLEALQFMTEEPVDIVLTDIRMPFMDGIELMSSLREHYPFVKFIVLSGHNDFDYIKKALQNGAFDYLLKPTSMAEVTDCFGRLVKKLDAEKQDEYRVRILERKNKLLTKRWRDEFLSGLFRNGFHSLEEIDQGAAEGEILLESPFYQVGVLRLDRIFMKRENNAARDLKLICFSLDNVLHDLWDSKGSGYHLVDKETAECYLLSVVNDPAVWQELKEQFNRLLGLFRSTVSIAVGAGVHSAAEIWRSAETSGSAMKRHVNEDAVIVYSETLHEVPDDKQPYAMGMVHHGPAGSIVLQQAKQFILQNYQRSITLKEVASHVYITPGHLSALFRDSGENYLHFLTAARMKKAIEYLSDPKYKIYEIAEMVGYSDTAYFTNLFKKHSGRTPQDFRAHLHIH